MEILTLLWDVLSFLFGLVWQAAWFILRDLISTLLWILIVTWLILAVRYRSFSGGAAAFLRYGLYGLRLFWRWLRGPSRVRPTLSGNKKFRSSRRRCRRPFGTMSLSEQLNMLLIGAIYLLFFG